MIDARGEITEQDYVHAQWLRIKPRNRLWLLAYLFVGLGLLAAPVAIMVSLHESATGAILAFVLLGAAALTPASVRRSWRRIYECQPSLRGTHHIEFSDTGMVWESPHSSGRTDWGVFVSCRESPQMFILFQSSNLFNMLPKRWFGEDQRAVDQFREILRARAIPSIQ
jgi:hypothetical protein